MNLRLNLLLLVIVAILGGWYYSQQQTAQTGLENLIKKEGEADYTGNQMTTMVYDIAGKPQYFAKAQEIKRYEVTERTEFFKPFLDLFDRETALKQWKVSADYAELTKTKQLNLQGNVKIESLDPQSRLQKIETDKLSVDLNTQDISSESVVKSQGSGFTTTGRGLTGNLKKQVATLLYDVKTYIEPTVIQKTPMSDKNKD
ncbi:LPS export ABC transporter periplasmic protein LptC [Muribacter muris]|uniref:Lipopolysaccharide export system protein LptC n=1 Tax=Muribacter muris TaxID=67855 RepID=A0A4Y9K8F0_9PAST|nr:LPS export ABC transporter periplasmic protein LptC [Muribacter muris]MBF0784267.1 LPS export ABC transporter periplasmic protein LptC [Muribacter muris]MBF0826995.1 LPS export ABC transporter periplasmic protein LptC [Muribacter muris]TFV13007.1 LPS export ABC transporter periplasmic protein LptC [Muribacter muris]